MTTCVANEEKPQKLHPTNDRGYLPRMFDGVVVSAECRGQMALPPMAGDVSLCISLGLVTLLCGA